MLSRSSPGRRRIDESAMSLSFPPHRPAPEPPPAAWEQEAWFQALPAEQRAEYVREHRARHARLAHLVDRERKLGWIDAAQFAALFALADVLTRNSSVSTVLLALPVGCVLGYTSSRLAWNEVLTGALALAAFFVFELVTRMGLSGNQMFLCVPVGFIAVWLAWRRDDRGM
jgi:hypothetical protein